MRNVASRDQSLSILGAVRVFTSFTNYYSRFSPPRAQPPTLFILRDSSSANSTSRCHPPPTYRMCHLSRDYARGGRRAYAQRSCPRRAACSPQLAQHRVACMGLEFLAPPGARCPKAGNLVASNPSYRLIYPSSPPPRKPSSGFPVHPRAAHSRQVRLD